MRRPRVVSGVWAVMLGACVRREAPPPPPPPPFEPVADVQQLMRSVVDPAADGIWDAVKTVDSAEGVVEYAPKTDTEWQAVRNHAVMVAESGNLLMMRGCAKDEPDWRRLSRALVDAGRRALAAASVQDKDALFDAGGQIYEACSNCHQKYLPAPAAAAP